MPKFEINDLVKIVKISDESQSEYIGQEGKIVDIDEKWEYPYAIEFSNKELQRKSVCSGGWLWKDYQLEAI